MHQAFQSIPKFILETDALICNPWLIDSNLQRTLLRASCTRASVKPISTTCCTIWGSGANPARPGRPLAIGEGTASVQRLRMPVRMVV